MEVPTTAYVDQKPGTSGLRKKVTTFRQPHYLANFVQSTFTALKEAKDGTGVPTVLVVGGDGRFFTRDAVQTILQVAAGNGVRQVWVGQRGLLSTPAVSTIIRQRRDADGTAATGAFILTASHNPGGPNADFGIKYNTANGGPAPERLTAAIYEETRCITQLRMDTSLPVVDVDTVGRTTFADGNFTVEVLDSVADYTAHMRSIFDFEALRRLVQRPDFRMHIDSLHGVSGSYVEHIFHHCLGVPRALLHHTDVLPDFGGLHPDPNLTYAAELVKVMGLNPDGTPQPPEANNGEEDSVPDFGVAFDGDADRNMVLGRRFFVNPSDSLAVLAANAGCVPFFQSSAGTYEKDCGALSAVARSMPTSGAVDRVAVAHQLELFEVPTGWKFFGNLMDSKAVFGKADHTPLLCGEESFGTGSSHMREKDGIWAALFWLSVLASRNGAQTSGTRALVGVQAVVEAHWARYGRNYYSRYDYEEVATDAAAHVMAAVDAMQPSAVPLLQGVPCVSIDNFAYTDPVDGSVSTGQGLRVCFADGSRFVLRLSGTGSSGATIRLYLEQYMEAAVVTEHLKSGTLPSAGAALKALIDVALQVSQMEKLTGRSAPSVIT